MQLSSLERKRKKAQQKILSIIEEFDREKTCPPAGIVDPDQYHTLTPAQIDQGISAFLLANSMAHGTDMGEGIDLYILLQQYLLNESVRQEINEVLHRQYRG